MEAAPVYERLDRTISRDCQAPDNRQVFWFFSSEKNFFFLKKKEAKKTFVSAARRVLGRCGEGALI
jgi:hypothetical protein